MSVHASDTGTQIIHCLFDLGSENCPEFVGIYGMFFFPVYYFVTVRDNAAQKDPQCLVSFLNFFRSNSNKLHLLQMNKYFFAPLYTRVIVSVTSVNRQI